MFRYFRKTFLEPRGKRWFGLGLIIESASARLADPVFARLREVLPYVNFDLLSKTERPGLGFRYMFRVKRPLGGLRLLLHARKHYDLVVFFATGERRLRLCRAVALLVMRPRRFFAFNEFGDGFWLHRSNWKQIRMHLQKRYNWERWQKRWQGFVAGLRALGRGLVWLAWLPVRTVQVLYAALFFVPAVLLLALLRLTYDTYCYRFRFFGKTASAPRRELATSNRPPGIIPTPSHPSAHHSALPR